LQRENANFRCISAERKALLMVALHQRRNEETRLSLHGIECCCSPCRTMPLSEANSLCKKGKEDIEEETEFYRLLGHAVCHRDHDVNQKALG